MSPRRDGRTNEQTTRKDRATQLLNRETLSFAISLLQWLLYVISALYCSPFELRSTFNILRRRYFFLAAQKATMCISDIGMKLSTLLKSHSIRELMGLDVASRCLKISMIKRFKVFPTQTLNAPKPKCVLKFSQHKL